MIVFQDPKNYGYRWKLFGNFVETEDRRFPGNFVETFGNCTHIKALNIFEYPQKHTGNFFSGFHVVSTPPC